MFACDRAGIEIAARAISWSNDQKVLHGERAERMAQLLARPVKPGYIQIIQNFPPGFVRDPNASIVIGRTMFETDRLPQDCVQACNQMDYIWVPSEFNKISFRQAGVAEEKLVVIPGCFDPALYADAENGKGSGQLAVGNSGMPSSFEGDEVQSGEEILGREKAVKSQIGRGAGSPFRFLSIFDWTRHKGWDVLLTTWLKAFEGREDVELVLKVWSTNGYSNAQILEQAGSHVREALGLDLHADRRVRFLFKRLEFEDLLALYRSADAYVLCSRGEGWGRPFMEAMALGVPVIGVNWSGNTAFMSPENSYLVDYNLIPVPEIGWREIPTYKGARWAEPDAEHLRRTLVRVVENPEEARTKAALAREEVRSRYNLETVGAMIKAELERISCLKPQNGQGSSELAVGNSGMDRSLLPVPSSPPLAVQWTGAQRVRHSLGHTNRELCMALLRTGRVALSTVPTEPDEMAVDEDPRFEALARCDFRGLSRIPDVSVCHMFPPDWRRRKARKTVVIQPWEYGYLPVDWVLAIVENVDEIWCYSSYVRDVYIASGVPAEKVRVMPLGVDTSVFNPQAPPYCFTTEAGVARANRQLSSSPTIFLYVGGSLHRKGIDILIEGYMKAFTSIDNVILVVKDMCVDTVYRIGNHRDQLLEIAGDPTRPALIYMDHYMSPYQLAGLYTLATCFATPHRGEGFCLPALEALACGCPVMSTEGSSTRDFVDTTVGWPLPAVRKAFEQNRIGEWECVGMPWMFEVASDAVAAQMRAIHNDRAEAKRRGAAGAERARTAWTWDHSAAKIVERIEALGRESGQNQESARKAAEPQRNTEIPSRENAQQSQNGEDSRKAAGSQEDAIIPGSMASGVGSTVPFPSVPSSLSPVPSSRISVCMIVRNEERVLEACLKSLRGLAYELIIIDTGSTDRTVEIAKKYGAKVYHFPWIDDFAAARNESLKYASQPWIFWCDADDTLPVETVEAILLAAATAPENVIGFVVPVQFVEGSGAASGTRVDHVKLFRNKPGLKFAGRIHEQILGSLRAEGGDIARLNAVVLHSGYDTSEEGQARKRERDNKLLDLELRDKPDDPFANFNRGMTSHFAPDHADAVYWLRRCLELAHPADSIVRKAYALLAISLRELGQPQEFEETLHAGLALYPEDPELHFHMGHLRSSQGRYMESNDHYLRCTGTNTDAYFSSIDTGILGVKTFHNMGANCLMMGDYARAKEWWLKAIEAGPEFGPTRQELFNAALAAVDLPTAAQMLEAAQQILPQGVELWWMMSRYAVCAGDLEPAERYLRLVLQADPGAAAPELQLAKVLLQEERIPEAQPILASLAEKGAAEASYYLAITHVRSGDLSAALAWMERAHTLNPDHVETQLQIANIKSALSGGN